ncbi:hypothetical protein B0H13DRAFT_2366924 [Mycena leptocephala]|nr:hypothetical protein B0H13DRAFT_2366924 [Mycena leptocephala]
MAQIKGDILKGWNIAWLKKHDYPLRPENAELRFHGNQNILENTEYLPVLDFNQAHKAAGNHEVYFTKMPKHAASMKGKVLALEIWMESAEKSTPGSSSRTVKAAANKKRKSLAGNASKENEEISTKRPRGPDPTKSTEIEIITADISANEQTGYVEVKWPNPSNAEMRKALIANDIFKSGKMKHCFKVWWGWGKSLDFT